VLSVTTRPPTTEPQAATSTALPDRPKALPARRAAGEVTTRPTSAHRPPAATPVSRPVDGAAVRRRHQRQRGLLLALLVAATLAAIAVLGFAAAHTGLQPHGLVLPGAVVLAVALWLRRTRRCPGVVVHCPSKHRRH
jgi:hypothetical protein